MKKVFYIPILVLFLFGTVTSAVHASAATLNVSPTTGNYTVGSTIALTVSVSSDTAINAVSGMINFSSDVLAVSSISKAESILTFWTQEPTYSNSSGTINFEGVLFSPGFTGSGGTIFTVIFSAIDSGIARVTFDHGSILANDGTGSNIVSSMGGAMFVIGTAFASQNSSTPAALSVSVPPAPVVTSSTHPDPTKFYPASDVVFSWDFSEEVTDVNIFGDHVADTDPGTRSDGLFRKYTYHDVEEGEWYFHIRLKNSAGWGPITHFAFKVGPEEILAPVEVVPETIELIPPVVETQPQFFEIPTQNDPAVVGFPTAFQALRVSTLNMALIALCGGIMILLSLFAFASATRHRHGLVRLDLKTSHDQFHHAFALLRKDLEVRLSDLKIKSSHLKLTTKEKQEQKMLQLSLKRVESTLEKEFTRLSKRTS